MKREVVVNMKSIFVVIFFAFVVVSCDKLNEKINEAFCQLDCEPDFFEDYYSSDDCSCSTSNETETGTFEGPKYATQENDLYDIRLKCKSQDIFHVEWDKDDIPFSSNLSRRAYFLQISDGKEEFFTEVFFNDYYTCTNVLANETYKVTLWALTNSQIFISNSLNFTTPENGKKPLPVSNVSIDLVPEDEKYGAEFSWSPSEDLSCYYEVVLHCTHAENTQHTVPAPEIFEITNALELFSLYISDLHFGFSYSLTIRAKSGDFEEESINKTLDFVVPSCLQTFKNLTICEPEQPRNLGIKEVQISPGIYDIHLNWSKPSLTPDFYVAKLNIMNKSMISASLPTLNITGKATGATFKHIHLTSYYEVHLQAFSEAGRSPPAVANRLSVHPLTVPSMPQEKYQNLKNLIAIILSVGAISVLIAFLVPAVQKRLGQNATKVDSSEEQSLTQLHIYGCYPQGPPVVEIEDKWQIDLEKVTFKAIIGEGAFGIVWQANMGEITVACKLLKDNATAEEVRQLYQEIEIMKQVGTHSNIVSMVGYITRPLEKGPILVVEYCPKGSLLSYLREIYSHFEYRLRRLQNEETEEGTQGFTNKLYTFDWKLLDEELSLTTTDMVSYGRQIASGMEYLSSQKVLHRDLAARNILMMDNKTVKVSDFGLSRDVYMDSIYCKTTNGKLPLRWMALESLTHQIYTSKSDVWSFGILMWEIASLGAIPYPGVETHELLALLTRGERMAKPQLCPDELYSIMINCWNEIPDNRPTFTLLKEAFEDMLSKDTLYLQIAFNQNSH